tara:strand:- start:562 stop:831 length:270 start_codon:yes stop_codon:yes gene_type:complete
MSPSFEFNHENNVVYNFIDGLLSKPKTILNLQLLLMTGVALNNIELMKYAIEINPEIVNMGVPTNVIQQIDNILLPALGIRLGNESAPQ